MNILLDRIRILDHMFSWKAKYILSHYLLVSKVADEKSVVARILLPLKLPFSLCLEPCRQISLSWVQISSGVYLIFHYSFLILYVLFQCKKVYLFQPRVFFFYFYILIPDISLNGDSCNTTSCNSAFGILGLLGLFFTSFVLLNFFSLYFLLFHSKIVLWLDVLSCKFHLHSN